ncbi:M14 family metallopeptidase [Saccharopolyspora rosea]|uniref:M14 family metallopeptidase n=1 Tax=Saccharopolyspora rosea TaxID=524884 RepID=A0ABW3FRH1_9PSEU|nr:M14 family metallopeptidase [Saccharopolyspora rosea]
MLKSRRKAVTVAAAACLALLAPAGVSAAQQAPPGAASDEEAIYTVPHTDSGSRTEIHRTGAEVLAVSGDTATVQATRAQAEQLRAKGLRLDERTTVAEALAKRNGATKGSARDFPPGDAQYHNYDEMNAELDGIVKNHPDIAAKSSIGKSFEGRDIPVLKISRNVQQDENEPEVLFDCNQHAREHLTTEMCLHIAKRFTDGYPNDPTVKDAVDHREIWIIPSVNPDGSSYDIETGQYRGWRKNRQDTGTDLNRNWGYKWGCCGGASNDPNAEDYRGPGAFSAPETSALRDFINSRVVGGKQQIKANIDFHTYSELVLWPFGWTQDPVTDGMSQAEHDRFERVGKEMAGTNGYTPEQSSALYVTDGDILDWEWAQHKILAYTFEMYPKDSGGLDGFYPPGNVIDRETARNDKAVDILLREAGA